MSFPYIYSHYFTRHYNYAYRTNVYQKHQILLIYSLVTFFFFFLFLFRSPTIQCAPVTIDSCISTTCKIKNHTTNCINITASFGINANFSTSTRKTYSSDVTIKSHKITTKSCSSSGFITKTYNNK